MHWLFHTYTTFIHCFGIFFQNICFSTNNLPLFPLLPVKALKAIKGIYEHLQYFILSKYWVKITHISATPYQIVKDSEWNHLNYFPEYFLQLHRA